MLTLAQRSTSTATKPTDWSVPAGSSASTMSSEVLHGPLNLRDVNVGFIFIRLLVNFRQEGTFYEALIVISICCSDNMFRS